MNREWLRHLLFRLGGAAVGVGIAVSIQSLWALACDSRLTTPSGPGGCPGIEFFPTLFGCLFGAIAADLIWSRRRS